MKKRNFFALIFPLLALFLECQPDGVVLLFWNPEGEPFRRTFSYFSLTPFGYANFAPLLTASLTVAALVLLTLFCLTGKARLGRIARWVTGIATVLSLGPLLRERNYFTPMGLFVTLSLAAGFLVLQLLIQKRNA